MTEQQFTALATLMRSRSKCKARQAMFLHLVERMSVGDAAIQAGISPNAASHAIGRAKRALALCKAVVSTQQ